MVKFFKNIINIQMKCKINYTTVIAFKRKHSKNNSEFKNIFKR